MGIFTQLLDSIQLHLLNPVLEFFGIGITWLWSFFALRMLCYMLVFLMLGCVAGWLRWERDRDKPWKYW